MTGEVEHQVAALAHQANRSGWYVQAANIQACSAIKQPGAVRPHQSAAIGREQGNHFAFNCSTRSVNLSKAGRDHHDRGDRAPCAGRNGCQHEIGAHHDHREINRVRDIGDRGIGAVPADLACARIDRIDGTCVTALDKTAVTAPTEFGRIRARTDQCNTARLEKRVECAHALIPVRKGTFKLLGQTGQQLGACPTGPKSIVSGPSPQAHRLRQIVQSRASQRASHPRSAVHRAPRCQRCDNKSQ